MSANLLVADIGNTHAHVGVFVGDRLVARDAFRSAGKATDDLIEAWQRFVDDLDEADAPAEAIVASVNTKVKIPFVHWLRAELGVTARVLGEDLRAPIALRVDHPEEVGGDRIVNAFWAAKNHPDTPVIVVDFGTALTFDVVDAKGDYQGGLILPGLQTAARALSARTALLPTVRIKPTEVVIGRNTIDSIRAGIYRGYIGLVDAVCEDLAAELDGGEPRVVATGGDAPMIAEHATRIERVVPELTLEGLRLIHEAAGA